MQDRAVGDLKAYRHRHRKSHHQIDGHCHIVTHPVVFFRTEPLCHENRKSTAQSIQPSGDKKHQRTGTSDRRQRPHSEELSCHDGICDVIKLLKDVSEKHGNHKLYDQLDWTPGCHIPDRTVSPVFFHFLFPFFFLFSSYNFCYLWYYNHSAEKCNDFFC